MKVDSVAGPTESALRRHIAQRVAQAHRSLGDHTLLSFLSGSTVEGLADERSDVDLSVVLAELPAHAALRLACTEAGGSPWFWSHGLDDPGGFVVAFHVEGIEVQVCYTTHVALRDQLDELLVSHNPDTPLHKLAEGLAKAEPLAGPVALAAIQQRLTPFPEQLARAMVEHGLRTPTPWKAARQLPHRDAVLWCREIQVEACYRMLMVLAGLNRRWFTRFQVKRMARFAAPLSLAPRDLAPRIEALLAASPASAFAMLHALESETLALVERLMPDIETAGWRAGLAAYAGR